MQEGSTPHDIEGLQEKTPLQVANEIVDNAQLQMETVSQIVDYARLQRNYCQAHRLVSLFEIWDAITDTLNLCIETPSEVKAILDSAQWKYTDADTGNAAIGMPSRVFRSRSRSIALEHKPEKTWANVVVTMLDAELCWAPLRKVARHPLSQFSKATNLPESIIRVIVEQYLGPMWSCNSNSPSKRDSRTPPFVQSYDVDSWIPIIRLPSEEELLEMIQWKANQGQENAEKTTNQSTEDTDILYRMHAFCINNLGIPKLRRLVQMQRKHSFNEHTPNPLQNTNTYFQQSESAWLSNSFRPGTPIRRFRNTSLHLPHQTQTTIPFRTYLSKYKYALIAAGLFMGVIALCLVF